MMKTVYIVLTDTGTLFTRMIKQYTKAPYNHASLALDEELDELYSFGRKSLHLPWNAGFVRENVDGGIYSKLKHTTCAVYELRIAKAHYDRIVREIERFERDSDRYSYNFLGLLQFLFPCGLRNRDAYFCSEFVATVLQSGGLRLLRKPPCETAPHDFMNADGVRLIYEGRLTAYRCGRAKQQSRQAESRLTACCS